jgi:hypothetical protein
MPLERLGETDAFGAVVASLFKQAGWTLHPPRPSLGGGRIWTASRRIDDIEVRVSRIGECFVDVGAELLADAIGALDVGKPRHRLPDLQLELPTAA